MAKLNKKMKMKSKAAGGGGGNTQAMQFNHALGQHILKNPLIIQALVEKVFYNIYLVSSDSDSDIRNNHSLFLVSVKID